jgi:hypothetical protein
VARRPGASARRYVGQPTKDYSPSPAGYPVFIHPAQTAGKQPDLCNLEHGGRERDDHAPRKADGACIHCVAGASRPISAPEIGPPPVPPGWQDRIVGRPGGESGDANVHAAWRLALAELAARAYAANEKLAALTVAGSVGTGLADRFSDLELDCYWFDPPGDLDRSGPVHVLGGELEVLWDYDHDEEEWSDDYRLGDLEVTVSSFLVSTIDRFIEDVVLRTDTDPVRHMRLAALQRSRPLHGPELITAWRGRAVYPDKLVVAMVERSLGPDVLRGWGTRHALAGRGDELAVHDLLIRAGHAVFGAVLALNGIYSPHRMIKWQSHLISELDVMPEHFAERLRLLGTSGNAQALREAETLLADTVQLVRARTDADISSFCEELSKRRRAVDPPRYLGVMPGAGTAGV